MKQFLADYKLHSTFLQRCMYGSSRRKHTRLVHNIDTLCDLGLLCDDSHEHEPWGVTSQGWATAEETAYPWPLCRRMAALIAFQIQQCGVTCETPPCARQASQLDAMRQKTGHQLTTKGLPWVSEFQRILHLPADAALPPNAKLISTPPVGYIASGKQKTVGILRSPEEFVQEALSNGHPGLSSDQLPAPMNNAVSFCTQHSDHYVAQSRSATLRDMLARAEQLKSAEETLKGNLSARIRKVLDSKRILLFKEMLIKSGSTDLHLVDDMCAGFDLTGKLLRSNVFEPKFRPAAISTESLRAVADRGRHSLINSIRSSGDYEIDMGVYESILKELDKGLLVGPIYPDAIPKGSTLTRRFGVRQKDKVRPIDDYKASLVNSSVTQAEVVTLHGIDHIACLGSAIMKGSKSNTSNNGLVAKCWDLASAYKQIPLSDEAYDLDSYIVVYNPSTCKAEVFQQTVLPFGSIASVTAFLRCAHALWHIGSSLLMFTWTSYFDDFLSFSTSGLARHTEICVSTFFHLMGWQLSTDKLVPYAQCCKVLGVELSLENSIDGHFQVKNTEARVEELVNFMNECLRSGELSRYDGERLRGRLQFASNQIFGRRFKNCLKSLNNHVTRGFRKIGDDLKSSLMLMVQLLEENLPRKVDTQLMDWNHLYVDASFEPDGYCGLGGVIFDSSGECLGCFSELVPADMLGDIMRADQQTGILELEGLAILTGIDVFKHLIAGKRLVVFTDNQAVQSCFVKCRSSNESLDLIIRATCSMEEALNVSAWMERVPSFSNPADILSRQIVENFMGKQRSRSDVVKIWTKSKLENNKCSLIPRGDARG